MTRPARRWAVLLAIAAVGGGAALLRRAAIEPAPPPRPREGARVVEPTAPRQVSAADVSAVGGAGPAAPSGAADSAALPHSLEGTDVDGWLGADDRGHLVVTPGARWFFDYFLSATGEEPDDDIRARIVAEIEKRLPAPGAGEAVELLDRYLAYRERVRELQDAGADENLAHRLVALHEIRRETFGEADAAVLFGEEEQVQAVDVERRQVLGDETLSPAERERRLQALDQQLPASARAARAEAMAVVHLAEDEGQLRAAGASPEEIHALREQRFGAEAADRLDALDRERAEWQQRLDDYQRDRQAIDRDATLTTEARAQAIDALRAERFAPDERARVEALDGE